MLQNLQDLDASVEAYICGLSHLLLLSLTFKSLSWSLCKLLFKLLYSFAKLVGRCWSMYEKTALKSTPTELNPLLQSINSNMKNISYHYSEKCYRFKVSYECELLSVVTALQSLSEVWQGFYICACTSFKTQTYFFHISLKQLFLLLCCSTMLHFYAFDWNWITGEY